MNELINGIFLIKGINYKSSDTTTYKTKEYDISKESEMGKLMVDALEIQEFKLGRRISKEEFLNICETAYDEFDNDLPF